ncbi:hypothetical protein K525DRAFT_262773 [Schizophyllum commune Loenen D]|nr:hypothetical protein K525DRAFT_262773 [Schizophyllum commune Loenen D]
MSSTESSANVPQKSGAGTKRKVAVSQQRAPSASEIARNLKHFETWTQGQGLEQVPYTELPETSMGYADSKSKAYKRLSVVAEPAFLSFIKDAYETSLSLFRPDEPDDLALLPVLFRQLCGVFSAHERLMAMNKSTQKYSESDYAANVYDILRSPAIKQATYRTSCALSLPQPRRSKHLSQASARVLKTRTVMPDCAVFASPSLHYLVASAFQSLKRSERVHKTGTATRRSSFRYQATPVDSPPDTPGFEFASSVWEDKKPAHQGRVEAYRQNRMSAASLLRHLHSLGIDVPIFGLIFANATVRVHVDWCQMEEGKLCIFSAPYPGQDALSEAEEGRRSPNEDQFYEWDLKQPAHILEVFFLIQNIDRWTVTEFQALVQEGVDAFAKSVKARTVKYVPWRRVDDTWFKTALAKENISASSASSAGSRRRRSSGLRFQALQTKVVVDVKSSKK